GVILMYLGGVNNWVTSVGATGKNLFDGVWHNIVATYDGTKQTFYIDNVLIGSTPASGSLAANTVSTKIGPGFKGQIDGVRIYSRGLNSGEVQTLYQSYGPVRNGPRTYYVSSSTGIDSNDGLSQATPWKNLDRVYEAFFVPNLIMPGDQVLLKRGDVWEGQIRLSQFGVKGGAPITIGAYGASGDPKPIIYGDGRGLTWSTVAG